MYQGLYDKEEKRSCLSKYISWTSYINLLISLVALGFGIYKGVQNKSAWEGTDYDWNKSLMAGLIVCSVLLFICAIFGIVGGRKQNKCCIFIFQIFGMILALTFLTIGFIFLAVTDSHITDITDANCVGGSNGTQIFTYGQQAYNAADQLLCSDVCKCKVTDQSVLTYLKNEQPNKFKNVDPINGFSKVQDCPTYNSDPDFSSSDVKNQANWLRSLEDSFQCTGMCIKPSNLYFFSDIDSGLPDTDTCKEKFENFVSTYGKVIYIVGLIVGFYLLLNTILSCCLCCQRKRTGQSYYERFANF